ncbi:hypothetical protein SAMN00120144_4277 [Hymenobacter roseosalivarius DSM 11622]|uniref:Uncharacterized protein n=1 Tax=Hymenobacter roseosalivarius DSM 11622 TaxID=645990 RepID=A0A1W1UJX4_9BACT|nr:hypothetical protein [Hymenobacter roseosalivarius]SMB81396.1 hypothetical protein SAMN00120144_4277 [Hymenobacter roseosalivarius DSM 11622]
MLGHLQFRALSPDEQTAYVFIYGTYLAQRYELEYGINLYHLDTFFCEVWVCQVQSEVVRLRSFTSRQPLLPYAALVRLPAL